MHDTKQSLQSTPGHPCTSVHKCKTERRVERERATTEGVVQFVFKSFTVSFTKQGEEGRKERKEGRKEGAVWWGCYSGRVGLEERGLLGVLGSLRQLGQNLEEKNK